MAVDCWPILAAGVTAVPSVVDYCLVAETGVTAVPSSRGLVPGCRERGLGRTLCHGLL